MATGVPNPAAPSMKAPKENPISSSWIRRSEARLAMLCFTTSNCPVPTVMSYTKMALRTIQPMGSRPNAAPFSAAARAIEPGIL
jgi:hypothetical protein